MLSPAGEALDTPLAGFPRAVPRFATLIIVMMLAACAVCSLLVWLVLAGGHGMFWRTDTRLDPHNPRTDGAVEPKGGWPAVTVIIPARNEADIIPHTLPSLLSQNYPGPLQVVFIDDASDDGTGDIARTLGRSAGGRVPLTVLTGGGRPTGWVGKVWAMEQGVRASSPESEWLLFTDADIAHGPESVARLIRHATAHGLDLTSLMAFLRARSRWERLLIPAFVYFFAQLYPFRRVSRPTTRTAGAAGHAVLLRRAALEHAGGLATIARAVIDDCSLARTIKRSGGRIWVGLADPATDGVRGIRPCPRLADMWSMIARSAYTQLRHSPVLLTGSVVGLALTYVAPPLSAVVGLTALAAGVGGTAAAVAGAAGFVAWAVMTVTYIPMIRYYQQPARNAVALPAVAVLYVLMTLDSARAHWRGRGAAWKGRTYTAANSSRVPGT
ncbi:glycosyltransferase [Frankia sp. Cppng1_Ct_nod]|uniref:glycosyltransferase n=1 Tax=Frankia sp. Cppng1_Ct_nod TaxID=2897162 RepID=UPI001F5FF242|nr:glycosyltransferase [Frankia sp. Cppng1_Ct_nod]